MIEAVHVTLGLKIESAVIEVHPSSRIVIESNGGRWPEPAIISIPIPIPIPIPVPNPDPISI
jgi:hypothetical protein